MSDAASKIMDAFFYHSNVLDSIADLIRFTYPKNSYTECYDIIKIMKKNNKYFENMKSRGNYDYLSAKKNMRNSWYHEVAFVQDINLAREQKMKFTAWKIIQFYYATYCALSAIVRCTNTKEMGHDKMINYFTNNILRRKALKGFFPQPFCFLLDQNQKIKPIYKSEITWSHGLKHKCPSLEKCLNDIFKGATVSLFHYFLSLRNWVNYEDTYIFRRLYSSIAKPVMYSNMHVIMTTFLSISEIYLMAVLGYDVLISEAQMFIKEFIRYMEPEITTWDKSVTISLQNRVKYYQTKKDWFE